VESLDFEDFSRQHVSPGKAREGLEGFKACPFRYNNVVDLRVSFETRWRYSNKVSRLPKPVRSEWSSTHHI
jgi:hypothetical protein